MHIHTEDCRWTVKGDGKRRCLTARAELERAQRAQGKRTPAEIRRRDYRQEPDGWEDEFGPVPLRVPQTQWYDEVVVLRLLNGENVGPRRPYRLEWAEFFKRNKTATFQQTMRATGLTSDGLRDKSQKHGYKWPRHLTDMGRMGRDPA